MSRKIPLVNSDLTATVDDEDYPALCNFKWELIDFEGKEVAVRWVDHPEFSKGPEFFNGAPTMQFGVFMHYEVWVRGNMEPKLQYVPMLIRRKGSEISEIGLELPAFIKVIHKQDN